MAILITTARFTADGAQETLLVPSVAGMPLDGVRPALRQLFARHGIHTLIAAPLQIKGRCIGTLKVGRAQPQPGEEREDEENDF